MRRHDLLMRRPVQARFLRPLYLAHLLTSAFISLALFLRNGLVMLIPRTTSCEEQKIVSCDLGLAIVLLENFLVTPI